MTPKISIFPAVLLLALLAIGCKPAAEEKVYGGPDKGPAYGDWFIDASIGDASTLLAPLASDASSFGIIGLIYDSLLKYDGNLTLVGQLAESWQVFIVLVPAESAPAGFAGTAIGLVTLVGEIIGATAAPAAGGALAERFGLGTALWLSAGGTLFLFLVTLFLNETSRLKAGVEPEPVPAH